MAVDIRIDHEGRKLLEPFIMPLGYPAPEMEEIELFHEQTKLKSYHEKLLGPRIGAYLTDQFLSGEYSAVKVAFTNFETTLTQTPWISQLLPIEASQLAEKRAYEGMGTPGEADRESKAEGNSDMLRDYIFEPGPDGVLEALLPLYINYQVYQMILEARASEHSARMVAMKAATDNANQMIKDLTLEYNKVRQAAITAELLEITTAMKAME